MTDWVPTGSRRWVGRLAVTAAKAVSAGAAAGIVLACVPLASADPEPSTQQEPAENQQEQDEQQQKGFSPPRPDTPNNNPSNNPTNNDASKRATWRTRTAGCTAPAPNGSRRAPCPGLGFPGRRFGRVTTWRG